MRPIGVAATVLAACAAATGTHEPVVGLPCEGCEAVFEGRPGDATHGWKVRRDIRLGERVSGYPS